MPEVELPDLGKVFGPAPTQLQGITPYPAAVKQALEAPQELPNLEDVFGKPDYPQPDLETQLVNQSIYRIMDAIGLGAKQGFGDTPIATPMTSLSPETEKALQSYGITNDYRKGQNSFLRTFNEGLVRDTAAAVQFGGRVLGGAVMGLAGGIGQTAEELGVTGLNVPGIVEDPTTAFALGPAGEFAALSNAARLDNLRRETLMARAHGAVSEGEAGFYDAHVLTPENAQARVDAAHEAGITPPTPLPAPKDVHELARRIDPPVFEKFDALESAKVVHRQTLTDAIAERENVPEALKAQEQLKERLDNLQKSGWNLTQSSAERITEAQERLAAAIEETPAMKRSRKALEDTIIAQNELEPQIQSAYRRAAEMMPDTEAETVKAVQSASEGTPPEVAAPAQEAATESAPTVAAAPKPRTTTNIRPVEGTGPAITRTLSEGVEAKAIEEKLTDSFGDLPEYREVSMADQAARSATYLAESPEDAKAVAMGQKAPPRGVLPESIFVAVEKDAIARGDVETLRQLATESKLTTAATTMGQRIRTLGERDKTSPVAAIADVQAARQAALEARNATALKDAAKEIKATVRRAATKRDAWGAFITAITCPE